MTTILTTNFRHQPTITEAAHHPSAELSDCLGDGLLRTSATADISPTVNLCRAALARRPQQAAQSEFVYTRGRRIDRPRRLNHSVTANFPEPIHVGETTKRGIGFAGKSAAEAAQSLWRGDMCRTRRPA